MREENQNPNSSHNLVSVNPLSEERPEEMGNVLGKILEKQLSKLETRGSQAFVTDTHIHRTWQCMACANHCHPAVQQRRGQENGDMPIVSALKY